MHRSRERIVNGRPKVEAHNLEAAKCELAAEILRSSGSLRLRAKGWSMLPAIWPEDTLVIDCVSINALTEGDIVMFSSGQRLVAHRVTKICEAGKVLTQGDATPRPDSPVTQRDLLGKVSAIVRNGKRIEPRQHLRLSARAVAAVVRRSGIAARVVVGIHGLRQTSQA
jgi:hypothetical protein